VWRHNTVTGGGIDCNRHDRYPGTYGANTQQYLDARFIADDVIQLNLTEEMLPP